MKALRDSWEVLVVGSAIALFICGAYLVVVGASEPDAFSLWIGAAVGIYGVGKLVEFCNAPAWFANWLMLTGTGIGLIGLVAYLSEAGHL